MPISKSIKGQLVIYLTAVAVFLAIQDRDIAFLPICAVAVFLTASVESSLLYFRTKVFKLTSSSIITGLIIGYVLSSDQGWWKFLAAAGFAIISKYTVLFNKKHVFNPAALGIFLAMVLFGATTQWKGTYSWYIFLPAGIYFAAKSGKLRILISYFLVSLVLFGIQALGQGVPLGNIFGYLSYFYIFIMVIEPKTSPVDHTGQVSFGCGIAILIFMLTAWGARFDVELFSLLVGNLAVLLIRKISLKKAAV